MLRFRTNIDATISGTALTGSPGRVDTMHCRLSVLTPELIGDYDSRKAIHDAIWRLRDANYKCTPAQLAHALQEVRPDWGVEYIHNEEVEVFPDIGWRKEDF